MVDGCPRTKNKWLIARLKPVAIFWLATIALAIVYLSHLGVVPVHATADECRRALVPMEMCISGDFLTPTINGEVYLNKPPLFSWIIAASYAVFGEYSPFALRFPVVISILLHGVLIFYVFKRYTTDTIACLTALAFMTNWRTLTLDSMLGLLEHTLALLMFAGFFIIYILGEKKKYTWLFVLSYFIAAAGFLIKGIPPLVHHGIALLVYFIFTKNFKALFSLSHLLGIITFLLTCAAYYIPFFDHNNISIDKVMGTLFFESSKRYGYADTASFMNVLFDYPLDFVKHFLPWTLLIIVFFQKNVIRKLKENPVMMYCVLLFITNTPFYWIASLKNPHYLFFLLPLIFAPAIYLWTNLSETDWKKRYPGYLVGAAPLLLGLAALYAPMTDVIDSIDFKWVKAIIIATLMSIIGFYSLKYPATRLYFLAVALIVLRLSFNWFVLPQRVADQMIYPDHAQKIVEIVMDQPLYINASYPAGYYDAITFPVEQKRNQILTLRKSAIPGSYYLVDDANLSSSTHEILYEFDYDYADNHEWYKKKMYLIRK